MTNYPGNQTRSQWSHRRLLFPHTSSHWSPLQQTCPCLKTRAFSERRTSGDGCELAIFHTHCKSRVAVCYLFHFCSLKLLESLRRGKNKVRLGLVNSIARKLASMD
jgi:hypothetical protein